MDTKFRDPDIFQAGAITDLNDRLQRVERHEQGNKVNLIFEMPLQQAPLDPQQWNTIGVVSTLSLSPGSPFMFFRIPPDILKVNQAKLTVFFAPLHNGFANTFKQAKKALIYFYDITPTAYPDDIITNIVYYPPGRSLAGQTVGGTIVSPPGANLSITSLLDPANYYAYNTGGSIVDVTDPVLHDVSAQFGQAAGTTYSATAYTADIKSLLTIGKNYALYAASFDTTDGNASGVFVRLEINAYTKNR